MKRITSACLLQMNHFESKEECEMFLAMLDRKHTVYKIEDRIDNPNGTTDLKIRKQYNDYPVGSYLQ